jgi:hypothetical protein
MIIEIVDEPKVVKFPSTAPQIGDVTRHLPFPALAAWFSVW